MIGSAVVSRAASRSHATATENFDTSPLVSAAAWAESDQKFRYGGSWALVRNATL